jgi:hypothetical protein
MAAGAVTAAVALLALQRSTPSARPSVAGSPANAAVSFGSVRAVDPASERIHLVVRATPANARIVIDKQIVLDNPCVMTFSRDGASHSVRVEADGYTAREDRFDATGDITLVIGLERHETIAAPVPLRPGAPVVGTKSGSPPTAGDATNPYAE